MTRASGSIIVAVLACVALLAIGGCDKGEPPCPPPPPIQQTGLPFPDTPDRLVANFKTAYANMDLNAYRDEVLADAYDFVLLPETVMAFGLPDGTFDHTDELAIAAKMFSGHPNEAGRVVSEVEIRVFQPQSDWLPVAETDSTFGGIPGALVRNYDVLIYFDMEGEFRHEVQGMQIFCVVADTVMHEGAPTPRYRLRGQIDLTTVGREKPAEDASWGEVKALFE
jgi:hypothetical protein